MESIKTSRESCREAAGQTGAEGRDTLGRMGMTVSDTAGQTGVEAWEGIRQTGMKASDPAGQTEAKACEAACRTEAKAWKACGRYEADAEYLACVRDILDHPVFQSMDRFLQHGSTTCKIHSIQVSYMTYCICRKRGFDYWQGARAGLLHDLFLYDWHTHAKETGEHFHGYTHPRAAMNNAVRYFQVSEKEKDMILRHMWPLTLIPPKSPEGFVLLLADKYCSMAEVAAEMKNQLIRACSPLGFG